MSLDPSNTLNPTKEPFVPANPDHVTMYVSGPTVYNFARFQLAQAARQSETPADRASHKLPLSEVGSLPGFLQQDPAVWLRRSKEGDDAARI